VTPRSVEHAAERAAERAELEAYMAGDAQAFRKLYRRHAKRLLRLGLSAGLSRAAAEDLVQTTFLRFHQARGRVRPDRALAPWLVTIAMNQLRDDRRREATRRAARSTLKSQPEGRAVDPARRLMGVQKLACVQAGLADLPEVQREAVLTVRVAGLSYAEAAIALDRSEGTLRQHVHRGLKRLRALLESEGEAATPPGSTSHSVTTADTY